MILKFILVLAIVTLPFNGFSQTADTINKTDKNGIKLGHWIKKYPNGKVQYDGYFVNNHPVGKFKRYYETDTLHSVLIYSPDGNTAEATLYHPNGLIASKGKFINQLKEGKWVFYSARIDGYIICEEEYLNNLKNGPSVKYYPDKSVAEKLIYTKDVKTGPWVQYLPGGVLCLKATYVNGQLQGKFEIFNAEGKPEFTGQYKDDLRDGKWYTYNSDGTFKNTFEYINGRVKDPEKNKKETEYLEALDKNKGKISDPEKTGTIWK
jgi:antitoxin component YwqK of YwqJK toxin-antitoxin module